MSKKTKPKSTLKQITLKIPKPILEHAETEAICIGVKTDDILKYWIAEGARIKSRR